jgi:ankyrin repeat protein
MGLIEMLLTLICKIISWRHRGDNLIAEFHDAVKVGDLAKVKTMLKDKPTLVSSKNNHGATPLFLASATGCKDVVELLLANKADVNVRDFDGVTPLHRAALYGHMDVVELLLGNKFDVNAKDSGGATPLFLASTMGHKDVAELLRQHGGHE